MSSIAQASFQSKASNLSLFDANGVAAATLLGTPLAGASLMALNYRRLGQSNKAVVALLAGLIVTSLAILLGSAMPGAASAPIGLILLIATRKAAESAQGSAVQQRVQQGARIASRWTALLIGVAFLAVVFGVVYFANLVPTLRETKVSVGANDEVFYSGSATKEQALALADSLKHSGFLTDRGVSVFLDESPSAKTLSFVVKEGSWDQPALVSSFEETAREAAPSIGGLPVHVRLMDKYRDVKAEMVVGKVGFSGDDAVYYLGTATESQAQSLGKALQADGFFQGKGSDVFLSKDKDGLTMSFVVQDAALSHPNLLSNFEEVVRETASSAGGLPIHLRLTNAALEVKQETVVK